MVAIATVPIEEEALNLQREIWDRQCTIWPGERVTRLDVCDPWVAAKYLGFDVQEGWLHNPGTRQGFQLGGFINRPAKLIGISDQQKPRTKRFTLAHEIGHLLRHPGMHHHREMPIHGLGEPREPTDRKELEANHFAGCYLVPTSLVIKAFRLSFGVESLMLTDVVAYELLRADFMSLMNSPPHSLAFERVVAQAVRYRGRQFESLNELFQVSPTTMAMRLRQVGLTHR
jgi:hypothetical protein